MVKGCVLSFFTQGKSRFFPNRFQCKSHYNAWGDSGPVLVWGDAHVDKWKADWAVRHVNFSCCICQKKKFSKAWFHVKWGNRFVQQRHSSESFVWVNHSESPLCINSHGAFFTGTGWICNYRITLQEAAVGLCSGTLHPYFSKSLAFPSWNLTWPFDTFFFPPSLTPVWTG